MKGNGKGNAKLGSSRHGNGTPSQCSGRSRRRRNRRNGGTFDANSTPLMRSVGFQRPLIEKSMSCRGSDYIGKLQVSKSPQTTSAVILAKIPISPSYFKGTRLTQMANLWERYRFNKLNIRYVPQVPFTMACQLLLYIDTDPDDDPTVITDVDALVRQATAQTGSQQWNFNSSRVIPLARRGDNQLYYTGVTRQNKRFNYQGTAYVIQLSNPVGQDGQAITADSMDAGQIYLDWDCHFETPQIEPEDASTKVLPPICNTAVTSPGSVTFSPSEPIHAFTLEGGTPGQQVLLFHKQTQMKGADPYDIELVETTGSTTQSWTALSFTKPATVYGDVLTTFQTLTIGKNYQFQAVKHNTSEVITNTAVYNPYILAVGDTVRMKWTQVVGKDTTTTTEDKT